MKGQQNGVSLIEVLVGGALILGILSATVAILIACYRHHRESEAAIAVHETALKATTLLEREIKDSSKGCVESFNSPPGLVFATPRAGNGAMSLDPNSKRPVWQRLICYYLEPDGDEFRLIRKEEPIPTPTHDVPQIGSSQDTAHFATVAGGTVVARGVTEFTVTAGSSVAFRLACQEIVHRGTSTEGRFAVEVETKVTPRN